ncbi:hypothetical protein GDO86_010520 [Hymenochirus boettgeri]|uniref:24-hydroxycholesterol 7-alpha-hydroxylase n=1 Tax=Hymenochirus boettgeri TaxID=247094 RepID=A0A8T2JKT6_9PIPI|nr:hypothetical protein GDO86_010520 [Hymenochirus boettgeri]
MEQISPQLPSLSAALGLLVALLTGLLVRNLLTKKPPYPPCIGGWIPWFGAAFKMGKAPLEFIHKAKQKHGPVFTVLAAGNRLTFVSGKEWIPVFFTSKELDFQQAVQKPVLNTASIKKEDFLKIHSSIHEKLKLCLSQSRLHMFFNRIHYEFSTRLDQLSSGEQRQVMYPAVVDTLFGKGLCPTGKDELKEFAEHFRRFDEGFEYGSQLPEFFLKDWSRSKQWLLTLFKRIVAEVENKNPPEENSKTVHQHVLDTLKGNSTYNNSLLLLWASQANANPVAKNPLNVTESDLKKLPFVKSCVLEAIRLRSPGAITRKVIQPIKIHNYLIPSGDLLMLSPYWIHRDPEMFPEPDVFKPERWKKANLEKNVFLDGFVAFGGGKFQCPGRWFALMEIHMLVVLILHKYEFSLLDPLPNQSNLHLVGTQQPDGPCRVRYKKREVMCSI